MDGDGLLAGAGESEDVCDGDDGALAGAGELGDAVVALAGGATEFFYHLGIVALVFGDGLAGAFWTAQLAAVGDVFVAATLEAELDILALHFGDGAEDGNEYHQERVRLAVGGEDGKLLLLEIDVQPAILAEHNVRKDVVGVAAQAVEGVEEEDVDFMADTIDEAFVQDGAFGAFFCACDLFGVGADNLDVVGLGVVVEVVELSVGVMPVVGAADTGVDNCGFIHCVIVLMR